MIVVQKTRLFQNEGKINQEKHDLQVLFSREKENSIDKKTFLALLKAKFKMKKVSLNFKPSLLKDFEFVYESIKLFSGSEEEANYLKNTRMDYQYLIV